MNCKRCGMEIGESPAVLAAEIEYCAFCVGVIISEWEAWQEQLIDLEPATRDKHIDESQ